MIRFCRSLGCEGLSDFKLRLASGLTGTIPITHTQVTSEDSLEDARECARLLRCRHDVVPIAPAVEAVDGVAFAVTGVVASTTRNAPCTRRRWTTGTKRLPGDAGRPVG